MLNDEVSERSAKVEGLEHGVGIAAKKDMSAGGGGEKKETRQVFPNYRHGGVDQRDGGERGTTHVFEAKLFSGGCAENWDGFWDGRLLYDGWNGLGEGDPLANGHSEGRRKARGAAAWLWTWVDTDPPLNRVTTASSILKLMILHNYSSTLSFKQSPFAAHAPNHPPLSPLPP